MIKALNSLAILAIFLCGAIGLINIGSGGVVFIVVGVVIAIISFGIADVLEQQQILFKEIREQNTLIIKVGQEVKAVKVKLNKIYEDNECV